MHPDPKSKTGPFAKLLKEIQICKLEKRCSYLNTRQFYFEPNSFTIKSWNQRGLYQKELDNRVMFVCESPGPSADKEPGSNIVPCFFYSARDHYFEEARRKYGLENCYITNTVKCGPRRGTKHTQAEVEACRAFLLREIDLIKPQVIVGVGNNAYNTLLDTLNHIRTRPALFKISHYAFRGNPWQRWDEEFPVILDQLRLLAK
jgi:uracil-DNA glycosylase family 4